METERSCVKIREAKKVNWLGIIFVVGGIGIYPFNN